MFIEVKTDEGQITLNILEVKMIKQTDTGVTIVLRDGQEIKTDEEYSAVSGHFIWIADGKPEFELEEDEPKPPPPDEGGEDDGTRNDN